MAITIKFNEKYVYFGPESGLHTQGEARAETYDITGPRYHDGRDLSTLTWYVRASHPNYRTLINRQLAVSVAPEDEEEVIITWPLEADFSAFAGELKVEFVGKSDGDEIIKLQSNGLQFKPSVEGTALPPKNVFEQAMSEMERLAQEAVNAAGQSKLNADKSESVLESVTETVQGVSESLERAEELVTQINGDAEAAAESAAAAKLSADNAAESEKNSAASASAAKASENSASSSKTAAAGSASAAKTSETNAAASQSAAANSASAAKTSETNAAASESAAGKSAEAAQTAKSAAESAAERAEAAAGEIDMSTYLQKTGDGKDVTVSFTAPDDADFSKITSGSKLSAIMILLSRWRNYIAQALTPTGTVLPFAGQTIPNGFLLCDGRAVSRTTYAGLFAVIGTIYGSGDGSTTFNLPDMRGRVAVGLDSDSNLGKTVGEKVVALLASQNGPHGHYIAIDYGAHDGNLRGLSSWSDRAKYDVTGVMDTGRSGEGAPHNNMQPSLHLYYLIKR